MNNDTEYIEADLPYISLLANDSQFRCTVCGRVGTVGRCCGIDTREPVNDLALAEWLTDKNDKANSALCVKQQKETTP